MRSHLQKNRAKWTGDVAQVIEHLLCKCEALSSNLSITGIRESTSIMADEKETQYFI
jgi:hypothetical protein